MTAVYKSSSKGDVIIASMEYKWLVNSLNILVTRQPNRTEEIEAMQAEVAKRDAAYAAQQAAETMPRDAMPLVQDSNPSSHDAWPQPEAFDPNPRAAIGGNEPPEEIPFDADPIPAGVAAIINAPDVAKHWSSLAITLRNTKPIGELEKVKVSAAAILAVTDDASAEAAGVVVKELRRVRQAGEDVFTTEKAPILAATKVCDEFGRPFKALTTEQTRIERLIGTHQAKVAEDRRKALAEAAEAERQKARDLEAAAAQQEDAGNDVVADILMDHGMKAESFAAIHETRAAAPVADLAKTQTGTVALGLRAPWTAEVVNAMSLREASGPLGQFIGPDALLAAAKAYVRANVVDGKFTGKELPGVRIFQDLRGSAR